MRAGTAPTGPACGSGCRPRRGSSHRTHPGRPALELEELRRAALGDHLAVALDLLGAVLCLGGAGRSTAHGKRRPQCDESHAIAASVLLVSPWLSSQLTSILSPFAPPFRR